MLISYQRALTGWQSIYINHQTAQKEITRLQEAYLTATVVRQSITDPFYYSRDSCFIFIEFTDPADEAEFIIQQNSP
jgi:hypothetical protein